MTAAEPTSPCTPSGPQADAFELLTGLTGLLARWSYEGTAGAERIVTRVAAHYGLRADVAFLPDAAVLSVGERTIVRPAEPIVPPLHQVSALKRLLAAIGLGMLLGATVVRRPLAAGT